MEKKKRPAGMLGFTLVWLGQIVSVLATSMSVFALTIWVFQKTGSVTALAGVQAVFVTALLALSPLAGVLVDRHDRKLMMMLSDLMAGLATIAILLLQAFGVLEVWHLYAAAVFQGAGNAFQWPAYSAAISTMIPKEQYGRANGMMSLIEMGPGILAPLLASALLPVIALTGILTLDVVTFVLAILVLFFVHIPPPSRTAEAVEGQGSILKEAIFGFRYIFARPSLLGLQLVFLFGNLFSGIAYTVLTPMILLRTGNDSVSLGLVLSAGAVGGVVGGVVMSAWGGFRRRVHGVLAGWIASGFFFALTGLGTSLPLWIAASVLSTLLVPLINGSNQAIWQAKVAADVQGRVFSARRLIAWLPNPIAPLIAGVLADYVLEPAMRTSSGFTSLFGWLVPPGPGAGTALLIVFSSLGGVLAGLAGYLSRPIREAEEILPDHDQLAAAEIA